MENSEKLLPANLPEIACSFINEYIRLGRIMHQKVRFGSTAGRAFGPAIFIIALLVIAIVVITALSRGVNNNDDQVPKAKAATLIQLGEQVHQSYDVLISKLSDPTTLVLNNDSTDDNSLASVMSPFPPPATMGLPGATWKLNDYASDDGFGTAAHDLSMRLEVEQQVCAEINQSLRGTAEILADTMPADEAYMNSLGKNTFCTVDNGHFYFYIMLDTK